MKNNLFICMLDSLKVKHTKWFATDFFNGHPHKDNMYGISKMLSEYKVLNEGIMLNDKKDIILIDPPFVSQFNNDLNCVYKFHKGNAYFISLSGRDSVISLENLKNINTGAVLVVESDKNSIEPNYKEHFTQSISNNAAKYLLYLLGGLIVIASIFNSKMELNIGMLLSLLLNIIGVYVCMLLVVKHIHYSSGIADKLCSMFKQGDCNNILESDASKLFGIFGWSEIGLSYFISNVVAVLYMEALYSYLSLISICALVYVIWSLFYQKFIAKQWCPLCLIVQCLLMSLFAINYIFGFIQTPDFVFNEIVQIIILYLTPFVLVHLLIPLFSQKAKVSNLTYELNHFKFNENIFWSLTQNQKHYKTDLSTSKIVFGNPNAEILITIISNPHCGPCSEIHPKLNDLLNKISSKICIQYLFINFKNKEIEDSGKFLIAAYLNDRDNAVDIYNR